jgi:hypothetical protein
VRCGDQAYRVHESRINDWANAKASGITAGPLFRCVNRHGKLQAERLGDRTVALVVKRHAASAGLDAEQ